MPDDITPEPTGDAPSGDGSERHRDARVLGHRHPGDSGRRHAVGPHPRRSPADTTRSMAGHHRRRRRGTPATAADELAAGAAVPTRDGTGAGGTRSSSQRAWIIALVVAAVLLAGGRHRPGRDIGGGDEEALRSRRAEHPGDLDHGASAGAAVPAHRARPRRAAQSRSARLWP